MNSLDNFPNEVHIRNSTFSMDIKDDLYINTADLNGEFCKVSSLFAQYATAFELASHEVQLLKVKGDQLEAQLDVSARLELDSAGVKKTEKMVENTVKGSTAWVTHQAELAQAQLIMGLMRQAKDAITMKRDMLIQLGATARQERSSDITMKQQFLSDNITNKS